MAAVTRGEGRTAFRLACVAVEVVCAAVVITAVWALPWARYEVRGSSVVSLHVGETLAVALVIVAALSGVVAALQVRWRIAALAGAEVVLGPVVLVLCVVAAAGRVSHANSVTDRVQSAATTAYAGGAGLAVSAALLLVCAAIVVLVLDSPQGGDDEVDQPVLIGSSPTL